MQNNILFVLVLVSIMISACGPKSNKGADTESVDTSYYLEKGKEISQATFAVLSKNLLQALADGDVENAISYCNLAASPLTDSISQQYSATIKRTSFLTRNAENAPTDEEKTILKSMADKVSSGSEPGPVVKAYEDHISFYAPIKVNNLCLQCHGVVGSTLPVENNEIIRKYYPGDQATGYNEGDLRGMWSISFPKDD